MEIPGGRRTSQEVVGVVRSQEVGAVGGIPGGKGRSQEVGGSGEITGVRLGRSQG